MSGGKLIDARRRFRGGKPARNLAACGRQIEFLELVTRTIRGDHVAHSVALALALHMDPESGLFDITVRDLSHFCGLNPYAVERAWDRMIEKGLLRLEDSE